MTTESIEKAVFVVEYFWSTRVDQNNRWFEYTYIVRRIMKHIFETTEVLMT